MTQTHFHALKENQNILLKRKEVEFVVEANTSLSKVDAAKLVAEKYHSNPENVRIKKIDGKFGQRKFVITANIYNNSKDRDATEFFSKKETEAMKKKAEVVSE